jgi:hypothetical protein
MVTAQNDLNAEYFVESGCQYYTVARFAMHAQRPLVCGNLFHHAVEMLLKGGLVKTGKSLDELRDRKNMGHNLTNIWRAYKDSHPKADLSCHDSTINWLDIFEEIRYPKPALRSIGLGLEWAANPVEVKTFGGATPPKRFLLNVSDIDDLIVDVFKTSDWNPASASYLGINEAALEAIRRQNKHADFLTKRPTI